MAVDIRNSLQIYVDNNITRLKNRQIESGGMANKLFEFFRGTMDSPFGDRVRLFVIEGSVHIDRVLGRRYAT